MPARSMYLVRDGQGRMRTIVAFSTRGAVQDYIENYPSTPGEVLEVKKRGEGDWEAFKLS